MEGYDLDEYEEFSDEGGEYEEEGGEYEEEEDRLPTQEELEYLELRQKLKESIRKKMKKKDPSYGLANSREKKKKMPYDNFGSFFGPSQPVIAQRVIQESKSLLENPRLAETVLKAKSVQNKGGSSTPSISKTRLNGQPPRKVDNYAKPQAKIQMLKNMRDYSFLSSEDAELPPSPKKPPKSAPALKPDVHLSQRQQPANNGRKVVNGREERKLVPTSSQMRPKPGQQSQRHSTSSRPTSTSSDPRKQVGRNEGSGPGRPSGQKRVPSKMPVANTQKMIPPPASRSYISTDHKPLPSRPPPAVQKRPLEHKRDDRGSSKGNVIRKPIMPGSSKGNVIRKPIMPSKPQTKQPARPPPSSAQQRERVLKRPARPFADDDDDDNAISMIRNMFGYNPNKYRGVNDDDDSDMEAGFDDIMMEEKRSAWIAAKEDEEELKKIEEEERRELMRKEAKKRKLSHR